MQSFMPPYKSSAHSMGVSQGISHDRTIGAPDGTPDGTPDGAPDHAGSVALLDHPPEALDIALERGLESDLAWEIARSRRRDLRWVPTVSLRVLLVATEAPPVLGGIARQIGYIEEVLRDRGHHVDTLAYPDVGRLSIKGMRFSGLGLKLLTRLHAMRRYDVIHIHGVTPTVSDVALLFALTFRRIQGNRPLVVYTHHMDVAYGPGGVLNRIYNALHHRLSARADLAITTTHDAMRHLKPHGPSIVLPSAVDVDVFSTTAPKDERFTILFVGQFRPYKGVRVLMQALSQLHSVRLLVAGSGPEEQSYRELAAQLALDVEFHVRVSDEQLRVLYQRAHVLVLPSLTRAEAFGMVVIEGMVAGCVPVASDLPGVREVVGRSGFLCPPGDAPRLAHVIERLRDDPELVEHLSTQGRARALQFDRYALVGHLERVITGRVLYQRLKEMAQTATTTRRRSSRALTPPVLPSTAVWNYSTSDLQRLQTWVDVVQQKDYDGPLEPDPAPDTGDIAHLAAHLRATAPPRKRWPQDDAARDTVAQTRRTTARLRVPIRTDTAAGVSAQPPSEAGSERKVGEVVLEGMQDIADRPTEPVSVAVAVQPPQRQGTAPDAQPEDDEVKPAVRKTRQRWSGFLLGLSVLAAETLTLLIQGYRVDFSPDLLGDEGLYMRVSQSLAQGNGFTLFGHVFMYHPPLFMWLEGAYIKLAGLATADPVSLLLSVRYVNIVFAACTAVVLLLFARKLDGYRAALVTVALFIVDAYVQRIDRRNMLETLAMLCALLGVYLFFTYRPRVPAPQRIAAGVAFGLAVLTKEAMFFELFALCVYVVLFRRSQLRDMAWVAGISVSVYLVYPLYLVVQGQGSNYLQFKASEFALLPASLVVLFGRSAGASSRPDAASISSGPQNLLRLIPQYGVTYLLIGLALVLAPMLLRLMRGDIAGKYLATWSLFSIAFGLLFGRISDQYFYYLVVPTFIMVGFAFARVESTLRSARTSSMAATTVAGVSSHTVSAKRQISPIVYQAIWLCLVAGVVAAISVDGFLGLKTYALGTDDGYMQVLQYVQARIPPGTILVSSDDAAQYYLAPEYTVRFDRYPSDFALRNERYFIMSSKDLAEGFNNTTPAFYDWVMANTHPLQVSYDTSYWTIGLYELNPPLAPEVLQNCQGPSLGRHTRSTMPPSCPSASRVPGDSG